jgi:hypothetical protein
MVRVPRLQHQQSALEHENESIGADVPAMTQAGIHSAVTETRIRRLLLTQGSRTADSLAERGASMGLALTLGYLAGMLASAGVGRSRAGVSQRGRLSLFTILGSLPWFLAQVVSMFAWPVFLCVWLIRGRPASPWRALTTGDGTVLIRRRTGS